MIWKAPEMISYLSDYFAEAAGDIVMSGAPSGVGAVTGWRPRLMALEALLLR